MLIGDPQQLDQPMQGSHPEGTDVRRSIIIFGGLQTIPADKGLFLAERGACARTSAPSRPSSFTKASSGRRWSRKTGRQGGGPLNGSGLRYLPVEHAGNQNCSPEEASAIKALVDRMLANAPTWTTGTEGKALTLDDILIIAPYNAQVFEIQHQLAGRACRDRRQVPGPGSAHRHLFHGDIKPRGRATRHGVSLQPQPPERRDVARQMHLCGGGLAGSIRSGVPHAEANSAGKRVLPLSRDGHSHQSIALKARRAPGVLRCNRADVAVKRQSVSRRGSWHKAVRPRAGNHHDFPPTPRGSADCQR